MFSLTEAGFNAFDLYNRKNGYCGTVSQTAKGEWKVYFNMTATKGSQRRFANIETAVSFIRDRRIKKGWGV